MKIGILTSGGDCPGLNAVIRAIVRRAEEYGYESVGIMNGWKGLFDESYNGGIASIEWRGTICSCMAGYLAFHTISGVRAGAR